MTEIKHHTIRANDIRQHYMEAGDGAPVVLLHGFPETSYAWRHQVPELAKKYRVIAPDLRGYGETDKPATGYDKRKMARDLRELMRALDIPKIALVGHDRGARVATRFAKDHPEALDRVVARSDCRDHARDCLRRSRIHGTGLLDPSVPGSGPVGNALHHLRCSSSSEAPGGSGVTRLAGRRVALATRGGHGLLPQLVRADGDARASRSVHPV